MGARQRLQQRITLIQQIRQFFSERGVLEVDTPIVSAYAVTDPHIQSLALTNNQGFLHTSPEYAMKRLLADGSGDIFQICHCFRAEEQGQLHRQEFSLLEWYRLGFDHHQLMDEMDQLLQSVLTHQAAQRLSYQQVFQQHLQFDPLSASVEYCLQQCQRWQIDLQGEFNVRDDILNILFSQCIEPQLIAPTFIYHFPASQAALAKIDASDPRIAHRFEVYVNGIELANGFHELTDAKQQYQRFVADNQQRSTLSLPQHTIDADFITALERGLPSCSGVALGIDRLLMLILSQSDISAVLSL